MSLRGLNGKKFRTEFKGWYENNEFLGLADGHVCSGNFFMHTMQIRSLIVDLIDRHETCVGASPYFLPSQIRTAMARKGKFSIVTNLEAGQRSETVARRHLPADLIVQMHDGLSPSLIKDPDSVRPIEYMQTEEIPKADGAGSWWARLHSKFLVFLDKHDGKFVPKAAVVGSYNLNDNPEYGLECVLIPS